jgi:hypothetical protein
MFPAARERRRSLSREKTSMNYKTIVLGLLQEQYPMLHARLCRERRLPRALQAYALALKDAHKAWMDELRRADPRRDFSQIATEALELAIDHLQGDLPCESPPSESDAEALSLDEAMGYLQAATPRA